MAETIFMIHGMFAGAWVWSNFKSFFEVQGAAVFILYRHQPCNESDSPDR